MTERAHSCPLCAFTDDSRDDVYDHLLVSHSKRSIGSVLLETESRPADRR